MMERLEGYENVDHVIGVLVEFHRHLADVFSGRREQTGDERSNLIIGYLADHQARRAGALEDFRRDAPRSLLDSWFQIPFPEDPGAFLRSVQGVEASAPDRIDQVVAKVDEFMERMLRHMRDRAETRNVVDFFDDLLEIEQRERRLRSRAMSSFQQI
jgi:hypothetical protein